VDRVSTAGEPPQLDASVTTAKVGDNAYTLTLKGELDLYSTPLLAAELEALTPDGPEVVVDLAAVTFLDSTALGAILLGVRRLRQAGGGMALVSSNPATTRLLSIVGVDRVVPVYETAERALERLVGSARRRKLERS
jgi:anti-sigma B factor antagonist